MMITDLECKMALTIDQVIVTGGGKPKAVAYSTAFADAIDDKYSFTSVSAFISTQTSFFGATPFSGAGSASQSAG